MAQQGDVKLFQTNDDGDIEVINGLVTMGGGLGTAAYLSLFGGNEDDDGSSGSAYSWWGNLVETDLESQYRSETQNLLYKLPATSGNLLSIQDAATRDLSWMKDTGLASNISVNASIPGLNMVKLTVSIDQDTLEFIENWRAR